VDVVLWGRDAQGRKLCFPVEDSFRPFFYVPEEESAEDEALTGTEFGFESIYGDKVRKVFVSNPSEVPRLRSMFSKHWEADIPYARRALIDWGITSGFDEKLQPCNPPHVGLVKWYIDIECVGENSQIVTARGKNKKAKNIVIGDELLALDEETRQVTTTTVTKVICKPAPLELYDLTLEEYKQQTPRYITNRWGHRHRTHIHNRTILKLRVTGNHPVYTEKGWVLVEILKPGDRLLVISQEDKQKIRLRLEHPAHNPIFAQGFKERARKYDWKWLKENYPDSFLKIVRQNRLGRKNWNEYLDVFIRDKGKCQICGSTQQLLIHHLNGDATDNSFENLTLHCVSCHRRLHMKLNPPMRKPKVVEKVLATKGLKRREHRFEPNPHRYDWMIGNGNPMKRSEIVNKNLAARGLSRKVTDCPHFIEIATISKRTRHLTNTVINFECTPYQNYFANNILMHNCFAGESMPNPDKDPVTCVTISDGLFYVSAILDDVYYSSDEGIIHYDSEENLLKFISGFLREHSPDCLVGWNIEFDVDYLQKRCRKLKVDFSLDGTCAFDLLSGYKNLYRRKSYRLKDIVLDESLTNEVEEKVNYGQLWEQDKPRLLERNQRHTRWIVEIDQKLKIMDYYIELRELAGLEDMDNFYPSVLFDTILLRRTPWALPSKEHKEHKVYEGAYVQQPEAGIFENIAIFDLTRFYPSIILQEKLDPKILHEFLQISDKLDWESYKTFAEAYIAGDNSTLLLGLVEEMTEERMKLQASEEHKGKLAALKALLNASYGVSAHPNFRLYAPEIPARVTEIARNIIKALGREVEKWGYKVIYADTDSTFCSVPRNEVSELEKRINEYLSGFGDYSVKLENFATKLLFSGAKKRYFFVDDQGGLHTTGYEKVRSDASNFTKEIQEEVMRMMLTDKVDEIMPYLRDKIDKIKRCKLRDIATTKTLGKDLDEYTKHKQNYILAAKELHFKQGEAVNIIPCHNYPYGVAVFRDEEDLKKKVEVDWDKVIQAQIQAKVQELLPLVNLEWREVVGQRRLL